MSGADTVFAGSIPDVYDSYLVPLIFEDCARDFAARAAAGAPRRVLETAAGSGVVTRALAPLLSPAARFTVTDLNPPMLDRARARQAPDDRLDWRPADALALPFGDGAFDAVLCQFGVMFFPDKLAGYREARRVLAPGGRFLFNVWDRIETNEFAAEVTHAAGECFPDDPPRFLARTPHGYFDVAAITADLERAGFTQVETHLWTGESRADTPRAPAVAYCRGTPLRNEIEARDPARLQAVTEHATRALAARFGPGPVSGRIQAHVIEARVPLR